MRLRSRLLLTSLAASVPLAIALIWLFRESRSSHFDRMTAAEVRSALEAPGRETCERDPATWADAFVAGRRMPPTIRMRAFVYDASFASGVAEAPPITEASRRRLLNGVDVSLRTDDDRGRIDDLVTPTGTNGACAFVLVRREPSGVPAPAPTLAFETTLAVWVLLVLAVVALALGPVLARLRRLSKAMRLSASGEREEVAVEGDDEIADVARAYNEATSQVREHVRRQAAREGALRSFLANTTHDISTPLAVLTGHLALLSKLVAAGGKIEPSVVAAAMNEAHYMAALIQNLGVAAKLDAGEPALELGPVDLVDVVERAVQRHRPIAAQLGISIELAVPAAPLVVEADVTLVERALGNLVHNAVRHNHCGRHVAVILDGAPETFSVRVIDDGPGIAPEARAALLADSPPTSERRRRADGGQGLGLRIASRIAALHDWQLCFVPTDVGACVELRSSRDGAAASSRA